MEAKDDDTGSTEYWRAIKQAQREKKADNRENSAEYLTQHGIPFVSKNGGAHLIVEGKDCFIDFWPGTGKWHSRCGKKGFGVRNLVAFIGMPYNAPIPADAKDAERLQAAIRRVLTHHGITKHGDGVIEGDLIAAMKGEK